VIRNIHNNPNGTIFNRTIQYRVHADDVLALGRLVTANELVVTQIQEASISTGLVVSKSTIKYMKININIANLVQDLITNGHVFEGVQNFRYLGLLINSNTFSM